MTPEFVSKNTVSTGFKSSTFFSTMINKKTHEQTNKQTSPNKPNSLSEVINAHPQQKLFFFSLTKEKMMFKLEKRLFYQGKICFFWMMLNDAEKTLRTDSSNHNPLFFFSLQISSSLISSSYRKKKLHSHCRDQTCFMQRQMI